MSGRLAAGRTHTSRVERLIEAGVAREAIGRIHAPIGLDIGAQGAAEIALDRRRNRGRYARQEPMMTVAGVILAAGRSARMAPRNKLLEAIGGRPVIGRVADTALASGAKPIVVVTGFEASAHRRGLLARPRCRSRR